MYCAMFLAIVLCYFQRASFYWLLKTNIERQVATGMLHSAVSKKCVAALRHLLQKVEPGSTLFNASCKKMLHNFMATWHITPCNSACSLLSEQNCKTSCIV